MTGSIVAIFPKRFDYYRFSCRLSYAKKLVLLMWDRTLWLEDAAALQNHRTFMWCWSVHLNKNRLLQAVVRIYIYIIMLFALAAYVWMLLQQITTVCTVARPGINFICEPLYRQQFIWRDKPFVNNPLKGLHFLFHMVFAVILPFCSFAATVATELLLVCSAVTLFCLVSMRVRMCVFFSFELAYLIRI